ncbi:fructose-1,6-bisphosphatase I [Nocardia amikacinitolerans]|uniref:Fructose-1,6-bisphosphatase class 1 n=1 Tax=Nocardia amikacinitolerans TaxID=756689 RepID=A0A285KVV5_9NOCA|nr:class 1 fructose-bisphosphatase [Nocardia amikacinitolerans]MCP2276007.1 fructose-1,6-bisphosphatase I [Nocardia amikacinitolerans]MCP2294278.1 fructose-1,6-bisphosphatase I [Nocardia amikacinitolerans]MCP2314833.1 fructose-1,6-bisphosphatase I [Nocardia amikacinitolerans]SNY76798.1 fructose-1,6-bisphosphatase I [Nocardia amikacinitolerans]
MPEGLKTLTRYTIEEEHRHPGSSGEFSALVNVVATATKIIANQVTRGAIVGSLGASEPDNLPPTVHRKLDAITNDIMVAETQWTGHLSALLSEQMPQIHPVPDTHRRGKYLLAFDPLDGSSNIDVNLPVGTIFSVLRAPERVWGRQGGEPTAADFLQAGAEQVCAGFTLYGPATMLVLTTGRGVDGFTLDREIGAFVLTHPRMRIPEDTAGFAINAANERFWERPVRRYVHECLDGVDGPRGRDFNMRWVASLVADTFHILTRGGVYLYPHDTRPPARPGRVALLYGASPIAFIVEQAGGAATTGVERVLQVTPDDVHQRVPLIFGSRNEVERIERYHREPDEGPSFDSSLFGNRSLFRSAGR